MPSRTKFAQLFLYNSTTDKQEPFLTYREDLSGEKPDSNMQVIDGLLLSHDNKIKALENSSCIYSVDAVTYDDDNTYIATSYEIKAYRPNLYVLVHFEKDIIGFTTLNINGLGIKSVMRYSSTGDLVDLEAKDCRKNVGYLFQYNGTSFILVGEKFENVINSETQPQNQVIGGIWNKILPSGGMTSYLKKEDGTYTEIPPSTKAVMIKFSDNQTLEEFKIQINNKIDNLEIDIDNTKKYIGYTDNDIYGVEVDFRTSTFTRLAGAIGKKEGEDFNSIKAFGGRRRCNLTNDGNVVAYYGDAGYTETGKLVHEITIGDKTYPIGTLVQVMVEQPKFYYKVVPLNLEIRRDGKGYHLRKGAYYMSNIPKKDFKVHPAFVTNGREVSKIYLSAYEGSLYDTSTSSYILDDAQIADFNTDMLSSIANAKPISGTSQLLTRGNARKLSQNRGNGWQQSFTQAISASQLLFLIEYASFNMQEKIGVGVTNKPDGTSNEAENTGGTSTLGSASGSLTNPNGYNVVTYRGEENSFGNIWKYVDGINVVAKGIHEAYISDCDFEDEKISGNYKNVGFTLAKTNGFASAFGYSQECDWIFIPSEVVGFPNYPVGDNFYQKNSVNQVLNTHIGGSWLSEERAGGFCWAVDILFSNRSRLTGARLTYIPDDPVSDQYQDTPELKITNLEKYVGYVDESIYGVEVDFQNNYFTRLSGSVGKNAGTDFDNIKAFNRKRCNLTDSGVVTAYYGDAAYTETGKLTQAVTINTVSYPIGTAVQVMVEQPKFYYKVVPLKLEPIVGGKGYHLRKARYYVSDTPKDGFKLHPAFVSGGVENDKIYLSAFEGCIYDTSAEAYILDDAQIADFTADKLSSIAGAKPASGVTQALNRVNSRGLAHNRGTGWELTFGQSISATQMLFLVENASFNMQEKIGAGVSNKERATGINNAENTGGTSILGDASGSLTNPNGYNVVTYRGEENLYGNMWKIVDGMNANPRGLNELYVADSDFTDNKLDGNYKNVGITLAKVENYVSAFGYNFDYDWLFVPSETLGNSSKPVGDFFTQRYTDNYTQSVVFGGAWYHEKLCGGYYWSTYASPASKANTFNARLTYVPKSGYTNGIKQVTLTNTASYPFNNSAMTVPISPSLASTNYIVHTDADTSRPDVGHVVVSDQLQNGFKLAYTGSAPTVNVRYWIKESE